MAIKIEVKNEHERSGSIHSVGASVGSSVGLSVGWALRAMVGICVRDLLGYWDGASVGVSLGIEVGLDFVEGGHENRQVVSIRDAVGQFERYPIAANAGHSLS